MPWPYNAGPQRGPARIDAWLPTGPRPAWRLEHHAIDAEASPPVAFDAMHAVRLREVPTVGALFKLRGLAHDADAPVMRFLSTPPFLVLEEESGRETVVGVLGPFWQMGHGRQAPRVARTTDEFRAALAEGCMAAIANFRVEPRGGGSRLWTETWVFAPRRSQAVKFTAYWMLIGPFSAWIRRLLLNGARRRMCEGGIGAPHPGPREPSAPR